MEQSMPWVGCLPVGVVRVWGDDRLGLLDRLATNDLSALASPGSVESTVFATPKGRIVDWVWVLARETDFLIRTSANRGARLCEWIDTYTIAEDVSCEDQTNNWELVVVHGIGASSLAGVEPPRPNTFCEQADGFWMAGLEAYGSRLEALVPAPAGALVEELLRRGGAPADGAQLELLRIEAGVPASHREFAGEVNPLELRLSSAVSFNKGCYVGQEVLARMDSYDKVARVMLGFEADAQLPMDRTLKITRDGKPLGKVTSVHNRVDGGTLGLGVVKRSAASPGGAEVVVDGDRVAVSLHDRPFWARSS